jgi:hypothetical protein
MLGRSKDLVYAVGGVIAIAVLVVTLYSRDEAENALSQVVQQTVAATFEKGSKTRQAELKVSMGAEDETRSPRTPTSDPKSLYKALHAAKNLRKFVHDARSTPLGNLHAMQAVFECGAFRDLLDSTSLAGADVKHPNAGTTEQQAAAKEQLLTKCQDFTKDELSLSTYFLLLSQARRSPVYATFERLRARQGPQGKNDSKVVEASLREIFLSGDPLLVGNALRGQLKYSDTSASGVLYIDGKPVQDFTHELYTQSVHLAACMLAQSCDESTLHTEFACAVGYPCSPSVNAYIEAGWDENQRRLIRQWAEVLVEIVRSGQVKRIMFP